MLSSLGISFSIAVFFTTLFERFYPRHRFNMPIRSAQKPYMQVFACLIRQLISLPSIYYYYLKFSSLHLLLLYSVFKVLFSGILLPFFGSSFLFADFLFIGLVGTNGLEPSTSRLSGVRSNHLSYAPFLFCGWLSFSSRASPLVEMRRIELLTPCLQGRCSPS